MEDKTEYGATPRPGLTIKSVLFIVILNLLVSAVTVYVYDRYFAVKIVAFDTKGYMAAREKLFYSGKITKDELFEDVYKVDAFLDNFLLQEKSKNTIILRGDAVIRNAKLIKP